jgi:mRNA degradation ribonuclease J1/J2
MGWYKEGSKNNKWDENELRAQIERKLGRQIYKSIEREPIILTILV